jgi:hypothetical protein
MFLQSSVEILIPRFHLLNAFDLVVSDKFCFTSMILVLRESIFIIRLICYC